MILTAKAKGDLYLALSLCDGLEDNDMQQIKILLEHNAADPNVMIPTRGVTPFHLIVGNECEKFAKDVTKLFLCHGGDPNVKSMEGMTPVHVAAAWGRVEILEILLANGGDSQVLDEDGLSPFHHALDGSHYEALAVLGRYNSKNDDDEDEDEVKVEIKLEKILINRGDIVAEYVTSEPDFPTAKPSITNEQSDNLNVNTNYSLEFSSLNTDNVTFRRQRPQINNKNSISPEDTNINAQCDQTSKRDILRKEFEKEMPQLNTCVPLMKFRKNHSTTRNSPRLLLNTSIVSASPNFARTPKQRILRTKSKNKAKINDNTDATPTINKNNVSSSPRIDFIQNHTPKNLSNTTDKKVTTIQCIFSKNSVSNLQNINYKDHIENEENFRQVNNEVKNNLTGETKIQSNVFNNDAKFDVNKIKNSYTPTSKLSNLPFGVSATGKMIETKKITSDSEKNLPMCDGFNEKFIKEEQTSLTSVSTCCNTSTMSSESSFITLETLNDTLSCNNVYKTPLRNNLKFNEKSELLPSDSETYKTPARSIGNSKSSNESFYSVDEEYAYVDSEKDVAFLERRLRFIPKSHNMDRVNVDFSLTDEFSELSIDSGHTTELSSDGFERAVSQGELALSNVSLRQNLLALGYTPGPITDTTYPVYLKRLYKLRTAKSAKLNDCVLESESQCDTIRDLKIPENILSTDWIKDLEPFRDLEEAGFKEYENPSTTKKYRGGVAKTSFNYLLLDPRITKDLPRTGRALSLDERWRIFLGAIFYVGKGKAARPLAHLYDAFDYWIGKNPNGVTSDKIQRILDIWREGKGVVCLQVFTNTMQEEAFTREAAMIDALGTTHLSNCNRGNYYGIVATMNTKEKRSLGKYLLYKAMEIFMQEGERQQFPKNIE